MTDLPLEEQVVPNTITCPGCGVALAVGYPKCPRCHASVPQGPRSKRQTVREEMIAGGTSLEPPAAAPRSWPWLLAAALVIGGLVVWVASRRDQRARAAPTDSNAVTDDNERDDETAASAAEDDEDVAAATGQAAAAAPGPADLGPAIRELDGALRGERLWAKVTADGDVVVIESALCGDSAIALVVDELGAGLRAAGARSVRCQEPHGAVVFDRGL